MSKINISYLDVNFPKFSYTIEELVDNIFKNKLDDEVRNFLKSSMGIERVYKAYDLYKVNQQDPIYLKPDIRLNDMFVEIAGKALRSLKKSPKDIGLLITVSGNQQYFTPAPTVEIVSRLGLRKEVRTQNLQGLACSSFSEALRNADGHFATGKKGDVLLLSSQFGTEITLDMIKQMDHISTKNKTEFYEFIYFIIFSDAVAVAILSREDTTDKPLVQIDTETIFSLKDISEDAHTKANVSIMPDEDHRIKFHMNLNPKRLEETVVSLSYENYSSLKKNFPKDVENVKFWGLHTAGLRFVDNVRKKCGIEIEKAKLNYDVMRETGNTGAISSLQLINESIKRKILTKNEVGGMLDYGWEGTDAFLYTVK